MQHTVQKAGPVDAKISPKEIAEEYTRVCEGQKSYENDMRYLAWKIKEIKNPESRENFVRGVLLAYERGVLATYGEDKQGGNPEVRRTKGVSDLKHGAREAFMDPLVAGNVKLFNEWNSVIDRIKNEK